MNAEQTVIDQPEIQPEPEPIKSADSIADHAKQFGPDGQKDDSEPVEELKPIRPVDQQRRDQGRFADGKQRMRSKDAVERINQLTGRAKTAEEKAAALERDLAAARAELEQARRTGTQTQVERAEAKVERAEEKVESKPTSGFPEAEPDENDPKFGGDYGKFLRAVAGYEGRKAQWEFQQQQRQQAGEAERAKTWDTRIAAAREKYQDYDGAATRFFQQLDRHGNRAAAIGNFVIEDEGGEDVIYYLSNNPGELDAIAGMSSGFQQVKALALLTQRTASSHKTPTVAGTTGSAPERKVVTLPKPPNPVRTEAQRASDASPDGEAHSVAEHRRRYGATR